MLLTVFEINERPIDVLDRIKVSFPDHRLVKKSIHFKIPFTQEDNAKSPKSSTFGIALPKIDSTIIVWTTYNMQVANKLNNTLQEISHSRFDFKPFSFTQKLFKKWFDIGSQVIECEFDSDLGERKVVTYDLKKSDEFVNMYEKIKVKAMVFSLNEYKALITAREEGRIAITPDMDYEKLTSILEALLLNDIMIANV